MCTTQCSLLPLNNPLLICNEMVHNNYLHSISCSKDCVKTQTQAYLLESVNKQYAFFGLNITLLVLP